jgi:hypothetical protein
MDQSRYPKGWDEQRVRALIADLDSMTDEEWIAEDEAAAEGKDGLTTMTVPTALVPEIRRLIAAHKAT